VKTRPTYEPERRILHLGNILNNGYLNAKLLRRNGWAADSVSIDYRHVQSQPEWEEVAIVDPSLDHFNPDWSAVDLGGYQRVPWFHDVRLADVPRLVEQIKRGKPSGRAGDLLPPHGSTNGYAPSEGAFRATTRRVLNRLGLLSITRAAVQTARVAEMTMSDEGVGQRLVDEFAAAYPDRPDKLTLADIVEYKERSVAHAPLFNLYPLIQAYSLDPIYVMLNNPGQPFVCFEHGTLREFPFENSARGRLYALAVKKAEQLVITNADCNRSADRLGLTNYTFIPHPVDEETLHPGESPLRERLHAEHQCDLVFLAPARHHWKNCPPGLENSWFKRNDILIRALGAFFKERPSIKALVVFFNWGQEVELSKQLIAEMGFADRVRWEPISSRPVMREYYNAADIVFDQFNGGIGTFGTVVPESLACAKPVLLNYKKELHTWCYPEVPPAINAASPEEIAQTVSRLVDNPHDRLELGRRGREWFLRYHSSQIVASRHIEMYSAIADRRGWNWRH
jgi:glycosyltransferase involved in cell wall biosynthesis